MPRSNERNTMTNDYPPPSDITVGRAYPATGCVPHVPSPAFSVQLSPQRMYTQAELDAYVAADRAKRVDPVKVTDEMVDAYLKANDAYWKRTDELPRPTNKCCAGTPKEATAESLRAAIAAEPERKPITIEQLRALPEWWPSSEGNPTLLGLIRAVERFHGIE
jgi:hypothetical protein